MRVRSTPLILTVGAAVWIADAAILWLSAAPLGHDEAQYAIAAKDLLAGDEPRWFYLSTGMNIPAAIGDFLGGSEIAMRFPTFLFGLVFMVAVWRLARILFDDATAAWTVAVLAGARQTAKWSADLLSDVPATTFLLLGTAVIAAELLRDHTSAPLRVAACPGGAATFDRPIRWRITLAAPLFAAAFYLRFASCIPIAIVGVAALIVGWRAVAQRPWPLLATVAMLGLLLVPHALSAIAQTGSPFGILLESKGVPAQSSFAAGLVTYVASNPFAFYGAIMPPVLLAGVVDLRPRLDRRTFAWLIAIADIVALGLISDAQSRYILLGTSVLAMLGVDAIRRALADPRVARQRPALEWIAVVAVIASWVHTVPSLAGQAAAKRDGMRETLAAMAAIRADRGDHPCRLVAYHDTQLEWYTGCRSDEPDLASAFARGERFYLVIDHNSASLRDAARPGQAGAFDRNEVWQPEPRDYPGRHVLLLAQPVTVFRVDPP